MSITGFITQHNEEIYELAVTTNLFLSALPVLPTPAKGEVNIPFIPAATTDSDSVAVEVKKVPTSRTIMSFDMVDETVEDLDLSDPSGIMLQNLGQRTGMNIEKQIIDKIKADATIGVATTPTNFAELSAYFTDFGAALTATGSTVVLAMSLEDYLVLIGDADYQRSKADLPKHKLVFSQFLAASEVIALHTSGFFLVADAMGAEDERSGASHTTTTIQATRLGCVWENTHIRKG